MNSLTTRVVNRRIIQRVIVQLQSLATAASANPSQEIQIPLRKERGPTDILHALESTIRRDPTAPDYKFIDDPFLIPTSLSKKRSYTLAREAGKRAAMWVRQEHPDLLMSSLSEPLVQAFLPTLTYENKDQVSEEILLNLIKQGRVADVLHVYQLLDENVSIETKQAIFELLCFYNSNLEYISEDFPEERSYQPEAEITKCTWDHTPQIEKLFEELQNNEKTVVGAYNALICGTAKYLKTDKAWELYNECLSKNIPLALRTYNNVLLLVSLIKDNNADRRVLIETILQDMVKNGIKPDVLTLNAALKGLAGWQSQLAAKALALSLLTEFKSANIEPSLATYYYLLSIFCRPNGPTSKILLEILDEVEKKENIEVKDPMDRYFFVEAMEVASKHLHDIQTGDRIHNLLLQKNNYKFIGGRLKESIYYRNYLQLILTSETIDEFMKVYDTLVPHIYIPEPAVMRDILEMLEVNEKEKSMELLPRFLSHLIMFGMLDRHQIMKITFNLMVTHCSPPKDSPLQQQYTKMAETLWTYIKEANEKRLQRLMHPAVTLGDMAVILLRGNQFEKMLEVLEYLTKMQDAVVGAIKPKRLQEIFQTCITRGHAEGAMLAIEYACDFGIVDATTMAQTLQDTMPLSETQENRLIEKVGVGALKPKATEEASSTKVTNV